MGKAVVVVDVQPAYSEYCGHIATQVAKRINNTRKPVIIMYVGAGITNDAEYDVREYLAEHGVRRKKLDQARFVEKDYGFFRGWMDHGVDPELIVKVGRQMLQKDVYSSEDLDLAMLLGQAEFDEVEDSLPKYDHLCRPCFDDTHFRYFDKFETCGGGSNECLAEIELYLAMKGKEVSRLNQLTY